MGCVGYGDAGATLAYVEGVAGVNIYLSEADMEAVRQASVEIGSLATSLESLYDGIIQHVPTLVGSEVSALNVIDLSAHVVASPLRRGPWALQDSQERLESLIDEHPLVRHFTTTHTYRALRVSDVTSWNAWVNSRTYSELFRPMGTPFSIAIPLNVVEQDSGASGNSVSLNRSGSDFRDSEMSRAAAIQPVIACLEHAVRIRSDGVRPKITDGAAERYRLTRREIEVTNLLVLGLTAQAIGHRLTISAATVRKHLENAYAKMGCHDRLAVVRLLLDPPGPYA